MGPVRTYARIRVRVREDCFLLQADSWSMEEIVSTDELMISRKWHQDEMLRFLLLAAE